MIKIKRILANIPKKVRSRHRCIAAGTVNPVAARKSLKTLIKLERKVKSINDLFRNKKHTKARVSNWLGILCITHVVHVVVGSTPSLGLTNPSITTGSETWYQICLRIE